MTDLRKRTLSALILIPALFAAVYYGFPFFELCCVAATVSVTLISATPIVPTTAG